ncbi:MAG TPA: CGNR zinc finger domain-containing protein [Actinomycetes bacterium]|nr:CGNR zinc finger domain-containing protein [Actinomycetes bacterium]
MRGPAGRPELRPAEPGVDAAVARLLSVVVAAGKDGTWRRLKACSEPRCRWVFYDRSRNRSGVWCAMSVCGNRAKVRAFRQRERAAAAARSGP